MDFSLLERQAAALCADERNFLANAANLASLIYHEVPDVNWAGFYFREGDDLVLGPFCGRPACTRLPNLRGVCGAAVREERTMVVPDVQAFADHIVCDAASRSEIVVPLSDGSRIFAVLDVDSPKLDRFGDAEVRALENIAQTLLRSSQLPALR